MDIFPYKTRIQNQAVDRTSISNSDTPSTSTHLEKESESLEPRRSKRVRIEKDFGDKIFTFLTEGGPNNYNEAMSSLNAPFWKEAINNEMESIIQNNMWVLSDLPPENKAIGCK